jgi:uncharacterized protein YdeI (YjbR/CyaY-like superfamily)
MSRLDALEELVDVDRAGWRAWLAEHHGDRPGVFLVLPRRGQASITYEEAVEEALCFGWIDGRVQPLGEARVRQHFAPRRAGGTWARSNKERVERLEREGRMTEAGRRVVQDALVNGSWSALDDIDALIIPGDLAAALAARPVAATLFERFSPSVRRGFLWWIKSAKRPETRARRVEATVWRAERGIREPGPAS